MTSYYVHARIGKPSGHVERLLYGPFPTRHYAKKFVDTLRQDYTQEENQRLETSIHQPIQAGHDD